MLKKIGKYGLCVGFMMGLTMIFLAGCGREKKIDYQIAGEDIEGFFADNYRGKSSVSQFANETVWKESWTISGENGEEIEVIVEAEVLLPETDTMSVIEVTVPVFDAEWKEKIIKTIFGDDEVYYNDLEHLPKRELEKLYAEYEAYSDSERTSEIAKLMETADDTYTPAETYELDEYLGKINGVPYKVIFYDGFEKNGWSSFSLYPVDRTEVCTNGYTWYMRHPYVIAGQYMGENDCELSEAQAEQMARSFLEELGLEYPVLTEVSPLLWGDDTMDSLNCNDWPANGYVFQYEYGMDGIAFPGFERITIMRDGVSLSTVDPESSYSKDASAYVYVTDRGILELRFINPVETTHVSENVKLLPLSSIREIMKEQIQEICPDYSYSSDPVYGMYGAESGKLIFNRMELIYFRVTDTQNSEYYSYIPVWRLETYIDLANVEFIYYPVFINAIDGSAIDFLDET